MVDKNRVHMGSAKVAAGLTEMSIDPNDVVVGLFVETGEALEALYRAANWHKMGDFHDEDNYRTCKLGGIRYRWLKG